MKSQPKVKAVTVNGESCLLATGQTRANAEFPFWGRNAVRQIFHYSPFLSIETKPLTKDQHSFHFRPLLLSRELTSVVLDFKTRLNKDGFHSSRMAITFFQFHLIFVVDFFKIFC